MWDSMLVIFVLCVLIDEMCVVCDHVGMHSFWFVVWFWCVYDVCGFSIHVCFCLCQRMAWGFIFAICFSYLGDVVLIVVLRGAPMVVVSI